MDCRPVPGGSASLWRCGDLLLKQLDRESLEHHDSLTILPWVAETLASIQPQRFRLSAPVKTASGEFLTRRGWTAWRWVDGRRALAGDIGSCVPALVAFHQAIQKKEVPASVRVNESPYGRADRMAWGDPPAVVHPVLAKTVGALYAARRPVTGLHDQLIHGDPNGGNMLVAPGLPPALIDFAPLFRPAEYAVAMFALWVGPREGVDTPLHAIEGVAEWEQMLIRAALRMMLIVQELDGVDRITTELRAADAVLRLVHS